MRPVPDASPTRHAGVGPLLLRGVSLADGRRADVRLANGLIESISSPDAISPLAAIDSSVPTLDLPGYLLLPAPVEAHAHLDKAYSADLAINETGDLDGAVAAWLRHRPTRTTAEITARARAAVRAYLDSGATAIRSHIDVSDDVGLRALETVAAVRAAVAGECEIQLVAFVGAPLCGRDGASHRALLRAALSAGADIVGACPARDDDPAGCIDTCLMIAAEHGVGVDLHVDEGLEPQPCTLLMLCEAVISQEFEHPVVASHCVSLGAMLPERAEQIAERVAAARIAVVCLPQTNLYLQGRAHAYSPPRGLTALCILRHAGVVVAAGADNLQDPFNCLGRADPLETAALLVLAGHDTPQAAYASVTTAARAALGLSPVEVKAGAPAELLAIRAASVREAIATAPPDRVVIHGGRLVARTMTVRHHYPPAAHTPAAHTPAAHRPASRTPAGHTPRACPPVEHQPTPSLGRRTA